MAELRCQKCGALLEKKALKDIPAEAEEAPSAPTGSFSDISRDFETDLAHLEVVLVCTNVHCGAVYPLSEEG